MEESPRVTSKRPIPAIQIAAFVCIAAASALAGSLLTHNAGASPQMLKLPYGVNGANCYAIAKSEHLIHHKITGQAFGTYYSGWVKKLSDHGTVTRTTLFEAGLAVSVCLKSK
jgi:hypothetical protein